MAGERPSRESLREVKREYRERSRRARLALVPPVDPGRRPGRILKPLLVVILFATAAVWWVGLPPPPPSDDRVPAVVFNDVP